MKNFLKEYWLWILIPFLLVVGGLAVLTFALGDGDGGGGDFVYPMF